MAQIKRQTGPEPRLPKAALLRNPLNNVKRPTLVFLNLDWAATSPAHAPATLALRNDLEVHCQGHFLPSGPSFEGIEFLSRTIMTGKTFSRNSQIGFLTFFSIFNMQFCQPNKKPGSGQTRTPVVKRPESYSLAFAFVSSSSSPNSSAATAAASAARSISGSSSGGRLREL